MGDESWVDAPAEESTQFSLSGGRLVLELRSYGPLWAQAFEHREPPRGNPGAVHLWRIPCIRIVCPVLAAGSELLSS